VATSSPLVRQEGMNVRTRRPPAWWAVVMALLATLWIAVTVLYRQGESGVRFGTGGPGISFERENDYALFAIDERAALLVTKDASMSLVEYGRGAFPFCPLCGTHELRGSIVNLAHYYKDGWIYTDHPGGPFAELYHVSSGQRIDVPRPPGAAPGQTDARTLPGYASRGLTIDAAHRITPALIHERFAPLSPIDESCVVFNSAFMLLAAVWIAVGLVLVIRGRRIA
jgi:hypothetical protein